jgi:hypothetical protein
VIDYEAERVGQGYFTSGPRWGGYMWRVDTVHCFGIRREVMLSVKGERRILKLWSVR